MANIYESELLYKLMERDGFNIPSSIPKYEAEIKDYLIEQVKLGYPKLNDYEAEWLFYNYTNHIPAEFPIETITNVTNATVNNVVPYEYKSAILKGNTKYRDIDTGDILDTFDETKNLELVSVKLPVLTTSNEDGTKTNILTVNEDVELRGIGEVQDTLDCLTGEVTEHIIEDIIDGRTISYGSNAYMNELSTAVLTSSISNASFTGKLICNNLKVYARENDIWNNKSIHSGISFVSAAWGVCIKLPHSLTGVTKEDQDDVVKQKFKSYLQSNPITIQYEAITPIIKTVDLNVVDENGNEINRIIPIEGTMQIQTDGEPIKPPVSMEIPVEAITQNLASFIEMEV